MFLDRRPFVYVLKPIYQFVGDRLIGGQYLRLRRLLLFDPLSGEASKDSAVEMLRSLVRNGEATRCQVELLTTAVSAIGIRRDELERQNQELLARVMKMEKRWGEVQRSWEASETLWLSLIQNAQQGWSSRKSTGEDRGQK